MRRLLLGIMLGSAWAADASAWDEFVNPTFCYRVDLPADVATLAKRTAGGLSLNVGDDCGRGMCIHVEVLARANGTNTSLVTRLGGPSETDTPYITDGIRWQQREIIHGDERLIILRALDAPTDVEREVRLTFPESKTREATRLGKHIVTSWKSLSECV